jgi:hypothetical protein
VSRYKLRTSVHNVIRTDTLRIKSYYAQRYYAHRDSESQVALIIGEAGIGKSRLAQHFHEQIAGTPHAWVEAAAGAFFQSTPFYAVTEMLRELLAWRGDESGGGSSSRNWKLGWNCRRVGPVQIFDRDHCRLHSGGAQPQLD